MDLPTWLRLDKSSRQQDGSYSPKALRPTRTRLHKIHNRSGVDDQTKQTATSDLSSLLCNLCYTSQQWEVHLLKSCSANNPQFCPLSCIQYRLYANSNMAWVSTVSLTPSLTQWRSFQRPFKQPIAWIIKITVEKVCISVQLHKPKWLNTQHKRIYPFAPIFPLCSCRHSDRPGNELRLVDTTLKPTVKPPTLCSLSLTKITRRYWDYINQHTARAQQHETVNKWV